MAGSTLTHPARPSTKRFVVLGGPGGYLTCLPAGDPRMRADSSHYLRRWQPLFTVNRPLTMELANAAKDVALRIYEVVS